MADSTSTPDKPKTPRKPRAPKAAAANDIGNDAGSAAVTETGGEAKAKFAKALEEAKAGAQALGKQAQDTAGAYREKISGSSEALMAEAKVMGEQAKDKAAALAQDSKSKAVEGIAAVSKIVAENAATIDEKLGPKYGDYARTAAKSMEDAAARLDAKDIGELGEDARQMVRKSPGIAIGIAAAAGFFLSRLFRGPGKTED